MQDRTIIKARAAQTLDVIGNDLRRTQSQLGSVIEHGAFWFAEGSLPVIPPQRGSKFLIQRDATEELGMALDSVKAAV